MAFSQAQWRFESTLPRAAVGKVLTGGRRDKREGEDGQQRQERTHLRLVLAVNHFALVQLSDKEWALNVAKR